MSTLASEPSLTVEDRCVLVLADYCRIARPILAGVHAVPPDAAALLATDPARAASTAFDLDELVRAHLDAGFDSGDEALRAVATQRIADLLFRIAGSAARLCMTLQDDRRSDYRALLTTHQLTETLLDEDATTRLAGGLSRATHRQDLDELVTWADVAASAWADAEVGGFATVHSLEAARAARDA